MKKDEILAILEKKRMTEVIELIEDAEKGDLEELELVEHLGLLADEELNREVLNLLQGLGVKIIYLSADDFDDEEEEEEA